MSTSARTAERQAEVVVVDPVFRDQFEMANPTTTYARVMSAVPSVFVGPVHHLQQLVSIICREMHTAFTAQGVSIPPWRSKTSFLSKWKIPAGLALGCHHDLRLAQTLGPRHRGLYKAAWPGMHKVPGAAAAAAAGGLARRGPVCRVDSQGALSSASDAGSDHLVAPLG